MVLALFLRWCRLRQTHILIIRLRLFAVKANANREQNLPNLLGQLCRNIVPTSAEPNLIGICRVQPIFNEVKCSFAYSKKKRWVLGVSHQLQSVILVSFFSLWLKRDYRKRKEEEDKKTLCISTENVKGWWNEVEIEEKWQTKLYGCSQNVPNNKSILVVFY